LTYAATSLKLVNIMVDTKPKEAFSMQADELRRDFPITQDRAVTMRNNSPATTARHQKRTKGLS